MQCGCTVQGGIQMLGKLLKHEFVAAARPMLLIWIGLPVLGILVNLSGRVMVDTTANIISVLRGILLFLFVVCVIGAWVMAVITMVKRFQQSMLSREAYLTHTLPVNVHQLVWSRMIVAVCYFAVTGVLILGSVFLAMFQLDWVGWFFKNAFDSLLYFFREYQSDAIGWTLEVLALLLVSGLTNCLLFYAVLTIGHSFTTHKMLLSVAFFFALEIIAQVVGSMLLFSSGSLLLTVASGHAILLSLTGFLAAFGVVYYIITTVLLRRKLNLE